MGEPVDLGAALRGYLLQQDRGCPFNCRYKQDCPSYIDLEEEQKEHERALGELDRQIRIPDGNTLNFTFTR